MLLVKQKSYEQTLKDNAIVGDTRCRPERFEVIEDELSGALGAHQQVGQLTRESRLSMSYWAQKAIRRSLAWYTRPIHVFQGSILRALGHLVASLSDLTLEVRELRKEQSSSMTKIDSLRAAFRIMSGSPNQLKENDKIIEYWDNAAQTDPVHETVTRGEDETEEEYQENWKRIGELVAGKIMSYSPARPVALEIGPGVGRITIPMSKYCASITALDISPLMAARAQEAMAHLENFRVMVINDEDLNFLPAKYFDLAYSISCFQHAEKKTFYRYLEGIHRALKPGGVLFFGVINLCTELGWKHFDGIVRNDYPEYFHTPDEISCYLQHAGYSSHQLAEDGETLWAIAYR
jgi:SAM-dependent methyltransferase